MFIVEHCVLSTVFHMISINRKDHKGHLAQPMAHRILCDLCGYQLFCTLNQTLLSGIVLISR
ncbi:hypothetical protein Pan54_07110 [Rubinisphaera italica]|uniref:Uncharacterized protein n=1 Tax=Rubinisphaera italica TaxID=2527969 RepID=A0A5C5XBI6_9PLAN|nr:hypothetical protein Pan54_07110 [Rubinisphaera italica]